MLADVLAALDAGDDARALGLLVEVWGELPDDTIGDAVVALGPRAARHAPVPTGETVRELDAAWHAAAASSEPCVRHHLLHGATEGDLAKRLLALGPYDPRVPRAITAHLANPKLRRTTLSQFDRGIKAVWTPIGALLVAARDRRALATLIAARREIIGRVPPARKADVTARIDAMIAEVQAACDAAPTLDAADAERARAILAAVTRRPASEDADAETAARLLADIYRAPADDGPRAVYADWLLERGDPRAELIALQLAPISPYDRVAQIVRTHEGELLGSLAPYVRSPTFARGFVARCTVVDGAVPPPDPAWATVTEITGGLPATDACPMPALTTALDLRDRDLVALGALREPPPLRTLGWLGRLFDDDTEWRTAAATYQKLAPRLAHLRYLIWESPRWLVDGMRPETVAWCWTAAPLHELCVGAHLATSAAWFGAIEGTALRTLVLHDAPAYSTVSPSGWTIRIERDASGAWGALRIAAPSGTTTPKLVTALDGLEPLIARMPRITRFTFELSASSAWSVATRRRLGIALDRHRELVDRKISWFQPVTNKPG